MYMSLPWTVLDCHSVTEELYLAIVEDDAARVYEKIEEGAVWGELFVIWGTDCA